MTLARLMIAFAGTDLPPAAARRIHELGVAGVTLFRAHNVVDPPQIRSLTAAIQDARPSGSPPVLVAADQECGQLVGLGDGTTPFAGAMALGATGDAELAERVAGAMARELRALGVNVNYALGHGVTAYGNLRNAFNRDYEEIFGFPSPKLNFVAGLKWTIARAQ